MFLRYAISRLRYEQNEMAYKIYISDTLYHQAQGQRLNIRYVDLIDQTNIDTRSGDEIATDIIRSAGLRFAE